MGLIVSLFRDSDESAADRDAATMNVDDVVIQPRSDENCIQESLPTGRHLVQMRLCVDNAHYGIESSEDIFAALSLSGDMPNEVDAMKGYCKKMAKVKVNELYVVKSVLPVDSQSDAGAYRATLSASEDMVCELLRIFGNSAHGITTPVIELSSSSAASALGNEDAPVCFSAIELWNLDTNQMLHREELAEAS